MLGIGIVLILTLAYVGLILTYVVGWHRLQYWQPAKTIEELQTTVCVIIPARNEAQNISHCLASIVHQQFPKHLLEVIVIDDHSTDETPVIVQQWAAQHPYVSLIKLAEWLPEHEKLNAYKKKAIALAINQTQQELIITTDADCVMLPKWLATVVHFYEETKAPLIAAPVCFIGAQTLLQRFQTLDFMGMIVATGASIQLHLSNMCNGANLCYTKAAFQKVDGFTGIDDIASGDDLLLMHKISEAYPNQIRFLKHKAATVYSYPEPTLSAFVQQRLRWASKSAKYQDTRITIFLAAVLFFNISILINFIGGIWGNGTMLALFCLQLMAKSFADLLFLGTGTYFFKRRHLLKSFLPAQFMHIAYIIGIGILGNFGTYEWKGRKVK